MKLVIALLALCAGLTAAQSREEYCNAEREVGPCRGMMPRWYFDREQGQCLQFTYGGCGGNFNNHHTMQECERKCIIRKKRQATREELCNAPKVVGPCRGMMPRWHFDRNQGLCVPFTYGGCQGNQNNHMTMQECERKCIIRKKRDAATREDYCNAPMVSGPCYAFFPKWHFDRTQGKCVEFVFGGCGGNLNNHDSRQECENRCLMRKKRDVTTSYSGPCDQATQRARGGMGRFVPQCDRNGFYKMIQHHGSTGYRWCVNPMTGQKIADTETAPAEYLEPTCPACVRKLAKTTAGNGVMPGTFVLSCTSSGEFEKTQCHGSTGYCWCVDPASGEELDGSRVRFAKPNC